MLIRPVCSLFIFQPMTACKLCHTLPKKRPCMTLRASRLQTLPWSWVLSLKLNLLWWHRLIKLYRFEVDNSIVHHLYIVLCVHHPKSSHLSSPFTHPLPSSMPPFPLPSGNHHTVFCVYQYYFVLNFFTFSPCSPTPLPSNSCQSVLCIYESVSTFFVSLFCPLDSTYK